MFCCVAVALLSCPWHRATRDQRQRLMTIEDCCSAYSYKSRSRESQPTRHTTQNFCIYIERSVQLHHHPPPVFPQAPMWTIVALFLTLLVLSLVRVPQPMPCLVMNEWYAEISPPPDLLWRLLLGRSLVPEGSGLHAAAGVHILRRMVHVLPGWL